MNKKIFQCAIYALLGLVIVGALSARFVRLDQAPMGFHVDELSHAVIIQCLETEGVDIYGEPAGLFGDANYGNQKPPTSIYFGALWGKLFGYSITSLRAMNGFKICLTILGLFFLARWLAGWRYGLMCVFLAAISPWAFQLSRIAIESIFLTAFMVWGIFLFLRFKNVFSYAFSGLLFAGAMYSYPPARLQIPLLVITLIILKYYLQGLTWRGFISFGLALVIVNIPLVWMTLSGELMGRFDLISIFSHEYHKTLGLAGTPLEVAGLFVKNFFVHLDPRFLFLKGDDNLVYATGQFGQLSWVEALLLIVGATVFLWKKASTPDQDMFLRKERLWLIFLLANILICVIPAALTWQDIPHSLRVQAMWPLMVLLSGFVLDKAVQRFFIVLPAAIVLAVLFGLVYYPHYFNEYPGKTTGWFSYHSKLMAESAREITHWRKFVSIQRHQNFHMRYYLMNYKEGETCGSTLKVWNAVIK